MASNLGSCITKQMLKSCSGEFDVECIHSLHLKEMGINDLGSLGECAGLETLDLSRNDVTKLYGLAGLTNLVYLNLSCNRISVLEGLQTLDNLKTLNLAGNLISGVDTLQCVTGLEKLTELHMQNPTAGLTNPCCMNLQYHKAVTALLPNLKILDGQLLYGKGSELLKICAAIDEALCDASEIGQITDRENPEPWATKEFWEKKSNDFETSILNDSDKQLEGLLEECRNMTTKAEQSIIGAKQVLESQQS